MNNRSLTMMEKITRQLMHVSMGGQASVLPFAEDIYLTTVSVAGMYFYDVEDLLPSIKEGDNLILKRNPENRHDNHAIEVRTLSGQMLGHIPRSENQILARLMDSGKRLTAVVENISADIYWREISIRILMTNL